MWFHVPWPIARDCLLSIFGLYIQVLGVCTPFEEGHPLKEAGYPVFLARLDCFRFVQQHVAKVLRVNIAQFHNWTLLVIIGSLVMTSPSVVHPSACHMSVVL
jgi:hypothetical protein